MNLDLTPAPYGTLTRRWTHLSPADKDREARRLVGVARAEARIEQPDATTGQHYVQLVAAGKANDEMALAWLATTHRPLLLDRGRALFAIDPQEWGSAALELLHRTVHDADLDEGRWLRSTIAQRLHRVMVREVRSYLRLMAREEATDPTSLRMYHSAVQPIDSDPHLDLTTAIASAFGRIDAATWDGLQALLEERPLASVAAAHDMSASAMRQRVRRVRDRLRPELAAYQRAVA
jgi:hypothetical protein